MQDFEHLPYRQNVGVVVINAQGAVFAAQRIDRFSDAWQMPQGGIDEGEDTRTAALRELHEETGIAPHLLTIVAESQEWLHYDLPSDLIPKLWNGAFRGQKQKWFLLQFNGVDADINIETDEPEFSTWAWMPTEKLLSSIVPFKRDVYEAVFAEFKAHLS